MNRAKNMKLKTVRRKSLMIQVLSIILKKEKEKTMRKEIMKTMVIRSVSRRLKSKLRTKLWKVIIIKF